MILKTLFHFLYIVSLLLLTSCKQKSNSFIDIEILSNKINSEIGINLYKIKQTIDTNSNPIYYEIAMNDFIKSSNSSIFKSYGLFQLKENGDSIKKQEVERFKARMLFSLKESIQAKKCKSQLNDSICFTKNEISAWLDQKSREEIIYIDYFHLSEYFVKCYRKKYLSKEEYKYIVLYLHVLGSIDAVNNKYPN